MCSCQWGRELLLDCIGLVVCTRLSGRVRVETTENHVIPTCVLRGISKVRKVSQRTHLFGLGFQLCEFFAQLI